MERIKIEITPILRVGLISDPRVSDGRLLPYITVNCSNNPALEQLIQLHGDTASPGDVTCTWIWKLFDKSKVYLRLDFSRPVKVTAHLEFTVDSKGDVVEWIRNVNGIYLQSSKYGDRASKGFGSPAILVEIPSSATFPVWDAIYKKALSKKFKKLGHPKKTIKPIINEYRLRNRELWFRKKAAFKT